MPAAKPVAAVPVPPHIPTASEQVLNNVSTGVANLANSANRALTGLPFGIGDAIQSIEQTAQLAAQEAGNKQLATEDKIGAAIAGALTGATQFGQDIANTAIAASRQLPPGVTDFIAPPLTVVDSLLKGTNQAFGRAPEAPIAVTEEMRKVAGPYLKSLPGLSAAGEFVGGSAIPLTVPIGGALRGLPALRGIAQSALTGAATSLGREEPQCWICNCCRCSCRRCAWWHIWCGCARPRRSVKDVQREEAYLC
jgi:hypothetical protein